MTSSMQAGATAVGLDLGTNPELAEELVGPKPSGRAANKFEWAGVIGPTVVFIFFIGLWEYMHRWGMRTFFDKPGFLLPSPATVVYQSFFKAQIRDILLNGLKWTAVVALLGLLITIVIGMTLAVLMAQTPWAERSFYPYLVALQAIPILAIVPIISSIFGGGFQPRLFVCVMISIFPIVTNTLFGLTSVDRSLHDLFTLRGASRWTRLWRLQFPAALPAIFTGFRISAGLSVIGAVVGEQFFRKGSRPGIGIVMEQFRQKNGYPYVFGGLMLAALLGITVFFFFGWLGRRVVGKWYEPSRST